MNTDRLHQPAASRSSEPIGSVDKVTVNLGDRTYPILTSIDWLSEVGDVLRQYDLSGENVMVFTSPQIGRLYFDALEHSLTDAGFKKIRRYDIPDGEQNKTLMQYSECCEALVAHFPRSESHPLVVNLGGGVVGDIGGFVAATYMRSGVPYIQIPTTLLGCVDCAVGGKVGVNSKTVKNIIGQFYQPSLVFADIALLQTLPIRELRSGAAEIIKYGVVLDKTLFGYLEDNIDSLLTLKEDVVSRLVGQCYRIKASVVEKDEQDKKGLRNVLNYGHTIGHALEMAAHFKMTHGEAISVGMIAANKIALQVGVLDQASAERIRLLIQKAGLPVSCDENVSVPEIIDIMGHDKKFSNGHNLFILPCEIGKWTTKRDVPRDLIEESIRSSLS